MKIGVQKIEASIISYNNVYNGWERTTKPINN
jgi:hypothetical protein